MKKKKNITILSDGSLLFNYNKGILVDQTKILFFIFDCQNFFLNKKKITKNFKYSKLSKQSKKYFN